MEWSSKPFKEGFFFWTSWAMHLSRSSTNSFWVEARMVTTVTLTLFAFSGARRVLWQQSIPARDKTKHRSACGAYTGHPSALKAPGPANEPGGFRSLVGCRRRRRPDHGRLPHVGVGYHVILGGVNAQDLDLAGLGQDQGSPHGQLSDHHRAGIRPIDPQDFNLFRRGHGKLAIVKQVADRQRLGVGA